MKYFLDTEFLEGTQTIYQWGLKTDTWLRIAGFGFIALGIYVFLLIHTYSALWFFFPAMIMFGISLPSTPPTIDLISIGIVAEDGREYYAISKDFNLKEAWNRYEIQNKYPNALNSDEWNEKVYWIRDNVLRPIFNELRQKSLGDQDYINNHYYSIGNGFTYEHLKELIKWYGKSNNQIAEEVKHFTQEPYFNFADSNLLSIEFYAYYADYDWVNFCWLFGRMIDLPKGFPMYCIDLKQLLDQKAQQLPTSYFENQITGEKFGVITLKDKIKILKSRTEYPRQIQEHNALGDAKWNFELYKFLDKID